MIGPTPGLIDAGEAFNGIVDWIHDEVIVDRDAPGLLVGLSGTDSLVTFLAAYRAFEKAKASERVLGVHFAPPDVFIEEHPEAEAHLWFRDEIFPWLSKAYPDARTAIDYSIDWRYDGLRWGKLADMTIVTEDMGGRRRMRSPDEQYWLCGTRNLTENLLGSYSNASMMCSVQPIIGLWKSNVLQIAEYLGVPSIAIQKSCETDCLCGRDRVAAAHPRELDFILSAQRQGRFFEDDARRHLPPGLGEQLLMHIRRQASKNHFKTLIPYKPETPRMSATPQSALASAFELGILDVRTFDHKKHVQVAWEYLKSMPLPTAVDRYSRCLQKIVPTRFNREVTEQYFARIEAAMRMYSTHDFEPFWQMCGPVLAERSANVPRQT